MGLWGNTVCGFPASNDDELIAIFGARRVESENECVCVCMYDEHKILRLDI